MRVVSVLGSLLLAEKKPGEQVDEKRGEKEEKTKKKRAVGIDTGGRRTRLGGPNVADPHGPPVRTCGAYYFDIPTQLDVDRFVSLKRTRAKAQKKGTAKMAHEMDSAKKK